MLATPTSFNWAVVLLVYFGKLTTSKHRENLSYFAEFIGIAGRLADGVLRQ
jgi:hypothetical protein